MRFKPWYTQYSQMRLAVKEARKAFIVQCNTLGLDPQEVLQPLMRRIIALAVYESNRQEGIAADEYLTQEVCELVFDRLLDSAPPPDLDPEAFLREHREQVETMQQRGATPDEVAIHNLAVAYTVLPRLYGLLRARQQELLGYAQQVVKAYPRMLAEFAEETRKLFIRTIAEHNPLAPPVFDHVDPPEELLPHLLHAEEHHQLYPMQMDYIHFLHRLIMMGLVPPEQTGVLRQEPIRVPDPDIQFPPPAEVPAMMLSFCKQFPPLLVNPDYEPMWMAAQVSCGFALVRPYQHANGRISRLLMNLVLAPHHPLTYLAADQEGLQRYIYALKQTTRSMGRNVGPMACLIAAPLLDIYQALQEEAEVLVAA
jgi:hypothetical protein